MELGGAGLALLVLVVVLLAGLGSLVWWRARGALGGPPPATEAQPKPAGLAGLAGELSALQAAGRWNELLRLLDRALPEWPVSSSLIEVARAVSTLERDVAAVRGTAVSQVVTSRLTAQTQTVADGLWSLADRLVAADRLSAAPPREQLQREDQVLMRLLASIKEAQAGLVEMTLASGGGDALRKSERRFLALAATARELQELGPPPRL